MSSKQVSLQSAPGAADVEAGEWRHILTLPEVSIEAARNAFGCGAVGCSRASPVYRVGISGIGERVLCAKHVLGFVREKIDQRGDL